MRKQIVTLFVAVLVLALMFGALVGGSGVTAAPLAAPTPVSVTQPVRTQFQPQLYTLMNAAIAADTRGSCWPLGGYSVADVEYNVDQTDVNTVTLKLQHTNGQAVYTDGATVVSSNAADASGMNQFPLYGQYTCLYADVTNTSTVTVTVTGWAK